MGKDLDIMDQFQNVRIKWPYATHLVDKSAVKGLLPMVEGHDPGALVLCRVMTSGKHKDLEAQAGRKMSIFPGDVFVGVLGDRYATDQFEGIGRVTGPTGHILGIGGVVGEVVSSNNRMPDPTTVEFLGRLADAEGKPLYTQQFAALSSAPATGVRPTTVLSLGASMNSGKTTTAMQMVRSLTNAGHRVAAAKVTGTACLKDPNLMYDAGAVCVLDFTDAGWPSTANLSLEQLMSITGRIRAALEAHQPEFVIIEIADGILQRETAMMLAHEPFRATIDAVTFAGPDALSVDSGVRRLREYGYPVIASAGIVANGQLGIQEVEKACGLRCLSGETILSGGLVATLRSIRERRMAGGDATSGGTTAGERESVPGTHGSSRAAQ